MATNNRLQKYIIEIKIASETYFYKIVVLQLIDSSYMCTCEEPSRHTSKCYIYGKRRTMYGLLDLQDGVVASR